MRSASGQSEDMESICDLKAPLTLRSRQSRKPGETKLNAVGMLSRHVVVPSPASEIAERTQRRDLSQRTKFPVADWEQNCGLPCLRVSYVLPTAIPNRPALPRREAHWRCTRHSAARLRDALDSSCPTRPSPPCALCEGSAPRPGRRRSCQSPKTA